MAQKIDEAYIELTIKDKKLQKGLKDADKAVTKLGKNAVQTTTMIRGLFAGVAAGAIVRGMKSVVDVIVRAERAQLKLNAVLKATGGIAGKSAQSLDRMARVMSSTTLFDVNQIKDAQAQLLTFTKISGNMFNDALSVAQDMSAVFDQSIKSSVIQVGKALNDPIRGMSALAEIGVSFSDDQRDLIKTYMAQNRLLDAQAVIIKELRTEFGGAAKEQAKGFAGTYKRLTDAVTALSQQGGQQFVKNLTKAAEGANAALTFAQTGSFNGATRSNDPLVRANADLAMKVHQRSISSPLSYPTIDRQIAELRSKRDAIFASRTPAPVAASPTVARRNMVFPTTAIGTGPMGQLAKLQSTGIAKAIRDDPARKAAMAALGKIVGPVANNVFSKLGRLNAVNELMPGRAAVAKRLAGLDAKSGVIGGSRVGVGGLGGLLQQQLEQGKAGQKKRDEKRNTLLGELKAIDAKILQKIQGPVFQ